MEGGRKYNIDGTDQVNGGELDWLGASSNEHFAVFTYFTQVMGRNWKEYSLGNHPKHCNVINNTAILLNKKVCFKFQDLMNYCFKLS